MKRLLIGLFLCCALTTHAQLTLSLSDSQTTINGNLANGTNLPVAGINASGTPSGSTYLRGDGAWATPAGGGGDSLWFTNTAAGGIGITNNFGARVTAETSWSTLTSTGMATYASSVAQAVYGNQYISYQGVNGIDLATGFTLLDGADSPALQPQSRVLVGNWNAQGNLDVDGDLNVDGTMLVNDLIATNFFTGFTNKVLMAGADGATTNVTIGSGLSLSGTTLSDDFTTNAFSGTGPLLRATNGAIGTTTAARFEGGVSFYSGAVGGGGTWASANGYNSNVRYQVGLVDVINQSRQGLFTLVTGTNGYILPQLTWIPTNNIPASTSAITNFVLMNLTNTVNGGGIHFVATNVAAAGSFILRKVDVTEVVWP